MRLVANSGHLPYSMTQSALESTLQLYLKVIGNFTTTPDVLTSTFNPFSAAIVNTLYSLFG